MSTSRVAAVAMVGAGLAASATLLAHAWGGAPSGASPLPASNQPLDCSIGSVPTLDVAAIPQSHLVDGAPYVARCVDDLGQETVFVFVHRAG